MALLRSIIGVKDLEMAEILHCSASTIHSIESGRLKLSEDLAQRVSHETDVSLTWLLGGNVKVAPVTTNHRLFTRELYERHRASKNRDLSLKFDPLEMAHLYCRLRAVLTNAAHRSDFPLATYKVERTIKTLADEFGYDGSVYAVDERQHDLARAVKLLNDNAEAVKGFARGLAKGLAVAGRFQPKQQKRDAA